MKINKQKKKIHRLGVLFFLIFVTGFLSVSVSHCASYAQQNTPDPSANTSAPPASESPPAPQSATNDSASTLDVALIVSVFGAVMGLIQFVAENRRRKLQIVQDIFTDAASKPSIKNVTSLLNYNPNKVFEIPLGNNSSSVRETIDLERFARALRIPGEIEKIQKGIQEIRSSGLNEHREEKVLLREYCTELAIEASIRNWFNEYIEFLVEIERHISAKLFSANDAKAYLLSWIQPIADQRNWSETIDYWSETSALYEQLFSYMYNSGPNFKQAEKLFERYKYKIPPLELFNYDISNFGQAGDNRDTNRALWLAKAARLMYWDHEYIKKNVQLWLNEDVTAALQSMSDKDYVVGLLKRWQKGDTLQKPISIEESFKCLESQQTDTQAFLFRKGKHIVLILHGSQNISDWATSLSLKLVPFKVSNSLDAKLPSGKVHRGFQLAWTNIERTVLESLNEWWTDDCQLWVTGHGLGGALANLAGVSLDYQGYQVSGIYTFGQPRVADLRFVQQVNQHMGNRIFRYVNNNDVVPMVPPPFSLLDPIHLYSHMGQQLYFNAFGKHVKSQRLIFIYRLIGLLLAFPTLGQSLISDHSMGAYIKNIQTALVEEHQRETKKPLMSVIIKFVSSAINR